jgi:GntR family transcriptional regulator/MocR family aminotransferase
MTTVVLPVVLDRADPAPLPHQLARCIRDLVAHGTLRRGERLPSSRTLATDLGVSRVVTTQAYEQLVAEGWLAARPGSGTYVASDGTNLPDPPVRPATARTGSSLTRLDTGTPWIDPRWSAGWRRAWREVAAARPPRGYDDPRGLPELREALAEHLARSRGLVVHPDEVLTTAGATDGWRQLLGVLDPGPVAIEDPGYRAAVVTAVAVGRSVVDLPAGTTPPRLDGIIATYVTPAHQHPTGVTMGAPERVALLAAARGARCLVVEDDYDSELRYDVAPIPALAALDHNQVAYLGTASKAVSPSLRLGWVVAPAPLTERLVAQRAVTHDTPAWAVQRAFVSLLRDGYLDRVIRSARTVYAERLARVDAALSPFAVRAGPLAGMYSTWLVPAAAATRARDDARRAGFDVALLSDYCRSAARSGLVVGVGGCTDAQLDTALQAMVNGLGEDNPGGHRAPSWS